MDKKEIKAAIKEIEYEQLSRELRQSFLEKGIYGWYRDPEDPDCKITKRGWKKNNVITWCND
jgi:hypothetical protein